jgi:hypothetical protein
MIYSSPSSINTVQAFSSSKSVVMSKRLKPWKLWQFTVLQWATPRMIRIIIRARQNGWRRMRYTTSLRHIIYWVPRTTGSISLLQSSPWLTYTHWTKRGNQRAKFFGWVLRAQSLSNKNCGLNWRELVLLYRCSEYALQGAPLLITTSPSGRCSEISSRRKV